ncbi:MAG: TIGR04282 family arsenosugar biosynthesis glycosyltransferase [Planctomycetales bacterium]|nr:TIGR04282 family arsenosugar biosynthesis glycosyltransferase [Planctomycetales bacterium]
MTRSDEPPAVNGKMFDGTVRGGDVLGVFAKYWQPGAVKTRLAASIGDHRAAELYRAFLTTTLVRLSPLGERRTLVFTPEQRCDDFAALASVVAGRWQLRAQTGGDLGQRMSRFFADEFSGAAARVVLLGSDSPTLPLTHVQQAFERLEQHDVVLGPSDDGGYYLVGMRSYLPAIFSDIDWSSPRVWQQTLERGQALGVTLAQLPAWYDIDTLDELRRFAHESARAASGDVIEQCAELARLRALARVACGGAAACDAMPQ